MSNLRLLPPRKYEEDIREHLSKWMNDIGLSYDMFQDPNMWSCDGCGCIFNAVVDEVVYLDRYMYASAELEADCDCHIIPKWIGVDVGSIVWCMNNYSETSWLCGVNQDSQWNTKMKCSICSNSAVVFANIPYEETGPNQGGPFWLCWEHLRVEPYDKEALYHKYATPAEKENEVPLNEVLSKLSEEPEELKKIRENIEIIISLNDGVKN